MKKIGKPIENYLDLFINISLNCTSIRSRLVSQPTNKLNSNHETKYNSTDFSFMTLGITVNPNLCGKNSTNFQTN